MNISTKTAFTSLSAAARTVRESFTESAAGSELGVGHTVGSEALNLAGLVTAPLLPGASAGYAILRGLWGGMGALASHSNVRAYERTSLQRGAVRSGVTCVGVLATGGLAYLCGLPFDAGVVAALPAIIADTRDLCERVDFKRHW